MKMDGKKKMTMMCLIMMMVMGMVVGQGGTGTGTGGTGTGGTGTAPNPIPFTTCYTRCMFFCMIEPQNACTCTSTCLKKCLDTPPTTMAMDMDEHGQNLGYCKLGCATSLCSHIGKQHDPGMYSFLVYVCDLKTYDL
ncbi:putative thionin-like protein [Helianthus debilis subsp. tardiflorus]